jgi:hypothetical protein
MTTDPRVLVTNTAYLTTYCFSGWTDRLLYCVAVYRNAEQGCTVTLINNGTAEMWVDLAWAQTVCPVANTRFELLPWPDTATQKKH